jgi:hypothetical protein
VESLQEAIEQSQSKFLDLSEKSTEDAVQALAAQENIRLEHAASIEKLRSEQVTEIEALQARLRESEDAAATVS